MTATRIRWETLSDGTLLGTAGTDVGWLFEISKPSDDADDSERVLKATLPGFQGRCCPGDDVDHLKALAEKWLAEFVSSVGAIFPEAGQ